MVDYTHLFRDEMPIAGGWPIEWDLFISAFNLTDRVKAVYNLASAKRKIWLIQNEYGFCKSDYPAEECFSCENGDESEYVLNLVEHISQASDLASVKICIDITGMMRPHLMLLVHMLERRGVSTIDVIYSEPAFYVEKEETKFSDGFVSRVKQVATFEGVSNNDTDNDLLIIAAGYEDELIKEVADDKEMARKVVVLGLPSLRADMYQQNALRTQLAADALGDLGARRYFSPANDPFVTATVLSSIVRRENSLKPITNLYLSPLSTKAQTLGFALYYLNECRGLNASIIFPFSSRYSRGTSDGLSKIWRFVLEFPIEQ